MISMKHIEYFISVAKTGQISKSANILNVSQATITMAIKNLEDMLKTSLFERWQRGVNLTYEGNLFLQHSTNVISSVSEMMNITNQKQMNIVGTIRLAISFTISGYYIAGLYAKFVKTFPNIKIQMIEAERNDIEEGLLNGTYDIGIFNIANIKNKDELEFETIISSTRRLWVNHDHKLLEKQLVHLEEIVKEPYIMINVDEASKTTHKYWAKAGYKPNVIYRTSSIEAVRSMVANGIGIAILADIVYRPWSLEGRRVEIINIADSIPSFDIGFAWAANKEKSVSVQTFQKFISQSTSSQIIMQGP